MPDEGKPGDVRPGNVEVRDVKPRDGDSGDEEPGDVKPGDVKTMADLARLAGVSTSTVSRALNHHEAIPPETRERILRLAERHRYRIDVRARNLRRGTTRTVAAVFPKSAGSGRRMSDPFYLEVLGGISDELAQHGYDLLISQAGDGGGSYARYVHERRADGLLVLERDTGGAGIRELQRAGVPFVVWGPMLPEQDYLSVGGDSLTGARLAAEHLLAAGRRQVAFVGGEPAMIETTLRLQGFRQALHEAGVDLPDHRIAFTDYTPQQAQAAVEAFLRQTEPVDAIFLCSDYMAVTALETLQRRGRAVPGDVALVGYDDVPLAQHATPQLTTVRQEIHEGGKRMARKLVDVLAGGSPTAEMLPVELVARGSTPPISGA